MCNNIEVSQKDLHDLLEIFERKPYEATACDEYDQSIASKCECLFRLDYSLIELDNANGVLSPRYPARIFVPEYEHGHMANTMTNVNANKLTNHSFGRDEIDDSGGGGGGSGPITNGIHSFVTFANPVQQHIGNAAHTQDQQQQPYFFKPQLQALPQTGSNIQAPQQHTIYEDLHDINKVRELITMAKYARCRRRFAVPVIMFRGKYICRSATISVMPETYGRKVVDFAYDCLNGTSNGLNDAQRMEDTNDNNDPTDESLINNINEQSPFSYDEVIKSDIQLLSALNVSTIVDLMVEKRKIKYFMPVSSSEKADPEKHYENFNILSLPYPGCEFFKKFRDNNYMAKNLHYNWKQSFNDAIISIPKLGPATELDIAWYDYKKWDLVTITQNYLKATLKYIQEENAGLLIHCISGWDRTPLFISLVRLSLWADGLIHTSLNALQMAYLTLAYDWYLFGHQLPDRLKRGEDIMFFCFHVLKHITDDEFSIVEHRKRTKTSSSSGSSVIVIKSDCCDDPLKEDYILNFDQDSNESFSNCSNCDMSITDNFFTTTTIATQTIPATTCTTNNIQIGASTNNSTAINPLTSRSPNPKRSRTSPISVPGVSAAARQRQESTSSNGSWQVVTDTGSIDSVMNGSYLMRFIAPHNHNGDNGSLQSYGSAGINGFHSHTPSNGSSSSNSNGAFSSNGSGGTHGITKDTNGGGTQHVTKNTLTLRKQRLNAVRAIFIQAYGKTIGLKFKEGSSMNLATFVGTLADQLF